MRPPIYTPSGAALEYAQFGLNIYDSCPHGCEYCYAAAMAKHFGKPWGNVVSPRPGIVEAVRKQLTGMRGQGQKIMLCFTCDPYPWGCDTAATRAVIEAIKESGNHIQLLTKGSVHDARRDLPLLDANDSFGVTLTGAESWKEPGAVPGLYQGILQGGAIRQIDHGHDSPVTIHVHRQQAHRPAHGQQAQDESLSRLALRLLNFRAIYPVHADFELRGIVFCHNKCIPIRYLYHLDKEVSLATAFGG